MKHSRAKNMHVKKLKKYSNNKVMAHYSITAHYRYNTVWTFDDK